jgi:shikimate dehydrogenase
MGNPVAHSRSPWIHARFAELTGQHLCTSAACCPLDGFAQGVRDFRARRARLQRHRALQDRSRALATHRSERVRWPAPPTPCALAPTASTPTTPTAWAWWPTSRATPACALAGRDVLLVGAGGAAAGVLGPLLQAARAPHHRGQPHAGPGPGAVQALPPCMALHAAELRAYPQALEADFDVIINATASSLAARGVPVPASVLRPAALAYDMMYGPAAQAFWTGRASTAPWPATAWACWWSRRPRRLPSGAACARHRRRCWSNCAHVDSVVRPP